MTNERLHELLRKRAGLVERMKAIAKQEDDLPEGETLPDDGAQEFVDIQGEIAALDARIQRLEQALAAEGDAAGDTDGDGDNGGGDDDTAGARGIQLRGGFRVPPQAANRPAKGLGFQIARFMIGVAHAKWSGGSYQKGAEMVQMRFKDAAVAKALNTISVSEGGALIPQDFMPDLIELLRARVVVRAAGPVDLGMPLGNMTIPRLAGGASAGYQGELDDIALTEEAFDDVNFTAKKLTAMVPVSNDLLRRAPFGVEAIIRDDLVETIARKEDITFIRSTGAGKSPIGWRSLVLPANLITVPAITAGSSGLDEVVAALSAAMLVLANGMSRMLKPHWFMAPTIARFIATRRDQVGGFYYKDEMAGGSLEGIPFAITQQIPTNLGTGNGSEIYLVDMADTVIADTMNVIVDMSDQAAYHGADAVMISTYQRDQSLFRVIAEHDFNMRHLQSLAILIVSDWKFTGLAGVAGGPWSSQPLNKTWATAPAAWPAVSTGANPPPTLYDPGVAPTSLFALDDPERDSLAMTLSEDGTPTPPAPRTPPADPPATPPASTRRTPPSSGSSG